MHKFKVIRVNNCKGAFLTKPLIDPSPSSNSCSPELKKNTTVLPASVMSFPFFPFRLLYMEKYQRTKRTSSTCPITNAQVKHLHILLYRCSSPLKGEILKYMPMALFLADWIIADMLAIRQSALGHVRYVLKDGLKWLPLYGWYFSQVIHLCEYLNVCKLQLGRWKWVLNYSPVLIT